MLKIFVLFVLVICSFLIGICSAVYGYGLSIASWPALIGFTATQWFVMLLITMIDKVE